jgi:hypothetical protein
MKNTINENLGSNISRKQWKQMQNLLNTYNIIINSLPIAIMNCAFMWTRNFVKKIHYISNESNKKLRNNICSEDLISFMDLTNSIENDSYKEKLIDKIKIWKILSKLNLQMKKTSYKFLIKNPTLTEFIKALHKNVWWPLFGRKGSQFIDN